MIAPLPVPDRAYHPEGRHAGLRIDAPDEEQPVVVRAEKLGLRVELEEWRVAVVGLSGQVATGRRYIGVAYGMKDPNAVAAVREPEFPVARMVPSQAPRRD